MDFGAECLGWIVARRRWRAIEGCRVGWLVDSGLISVFGFVVVVNRGSAMLGGACLWLFGEG